MDAMIRRSPQALYLLDESIPLYDPLDGPHDRRTDFSGVALR
jgi:hypothetical protein